MANKYFYRTLAIFTFLLAMWATMLTMWLTLPDEVINWTRFKIIIGILGVLSYFWIHGLIVAFIRDKFMDELEAGITILSLIKRIKGINVNTDNNIVERLSCAGCKNLDYYNNGSPFCIKKLDHACITSGHKFREPKYEEGET